MRAEILTIGDELCRGEIVDTNSSHLAARLWDLSITTRWMTSCNDDDADIAAALSQAVARADLVVCSGGLGPTEDDLTVDVVARLAGVEPVIDEPSRTRMEAWFAQRHLPGSGGQPAAPLAITAIQLRQVRVPAGARVHPNPAGLAPGFEIPLRGVPVVCLPGFPREIHAILEASLVRRFAELREAAGERRFEDGVRRRARSSTSRAGSIACSAAASRRSRRRAAALSTGSPAPRSTTR